MSLFPYHGLTHSWTCHLHIPPYGGMERELGIFLKDELPKLEHPRSNGMLVDARFLPEDILVDVLSRLPVRDLLRLRCVCKSWCALIDDATFIKRHYELQYCICKEDGDIPFICWGPETVNMHANLHVQVLSKQNGDDVFMDLTADLVCDSAAYFTNAPDYLFDKCIFVGAANGVVCFIWGYHDLGLWNPATREFKAIAPWLNQSIQAYLLNLIGFGFDSISNDLKIVRGNCCDGIPSGYEVYSLRSNSWKWISEPSPPCDPYSKGFPTEAYLNGACYWSVYSIPSETPVILSFDFGTEVFEVLNQPNNAIGAEIGYHYDWSITVYKERLAFVVSRADMGKEVRHFDLWAVTEFHGNTGIPLSWQHLFTIGPFPSLDVQYFETFRMDGDMFLVTKSAEFGEVISLYNPSTGTFKNLGYFFSKFHRYVESMFPLSKRLTRS